MKRRLLICQVLAFLLVSGRPAHAHIGGFFDWLGELSGPGPFKGIGVTGEVVCYGTNRVDPAAVAPGVIQVPNPGAALTSGPAVDGTAPLPKFHWLWKCSPLDRDKLRVYVSPVVGRMKTGDNPYHYAEDKLSLKEDVVAVPLLATVDTNIPWLIERAGVLGRGLFVGGGIGAIRFSGGELFDAFWKPAFEVPRVTFKFNVSTRVSMFVQFSVKFIRPVDPVEDFGAAEGERSTTYRKPFVTVGVAY